LFSSKWRTCVRVRGRLERSRCVWKASEASDSWAGGPGGFVNRYCGHLPTNGVEAVMVVLRFQLDPENLCSTASSPDRIGSALVGQSVTKRRAEE
jgi:hypothetical protein